LIPGALVTPSLTLPVTELHVKVLEAATTVGDITGECFLLPIMSAGPDFQFRELCSPQFTPLPAPVRAISQMHVRSEFAKSKFTNLATGGISKPKRLESLFEDTLTAETISNRFANRPLVYEYMNFLVQPVLPLANTDTFDFIQQSFRYVRGSLRFKYAATDVVLYNAAMFSNFSSTAASAYPTTTYPVGVSGNGFAGNASNQNTVFETEIPFQCVTDWTWTAPALPYGSTAAYENYPAPYYVNWQALSEGATLLAIFVAAGKDYQLAFLMPPFVYNLYPGFSVPVAKSNKPLTYKS
jgi:hypothetical protein